MRLSALIFFLTLSPAFAADNGLDPMAFNGFSDTAKGLSVTEVGQPAKMQVPLRPVYVEQPVVIQQANNGKYRPYIPSLDRVKAVFLAPWDPHRDAGKGYGFMEIEEIMAAIDKTAAELSKMGVKVIIVGNPGPELRASLAAIQANGANMANVETFAKKDFHQNHVWFRDYGLLPIKDMTTGRWDNISMIIRGKPLDDLLRFASERFGLRTIDSLDVSETGGQLRGGNILMDGAGRCFSAGFKHPLYENTFKCTKTVTFPCRSDVCHVDEYVTFLKNDTVVTNKAEFVPALREAGYRNIRMVPDDIHLSLANVLIVNNTVFMMYLDEVRDKMLAAKAVFEAEGYRVVPINSGGAGRQYGAVHCLTKEIPE
ncbi:MAG: agmatine deiminase family protein [Elusimicrobiales bacterium]|nr:agmatine deiminase family protein [Elusimicrobiales bacterium]